MKNNPSNRSSVATLTLAATLSVILLTACSSKPPGCADEETLNLVRSAYLDRWKQIAASYVENFHMSPEETDRYNNALKLEIRDVVSDGYNESSRKHSCRGVLAFSTLTGKSFSSSRAFTSQAAADGGGKFIVQVEGLDSIAPALGPDFSNYVTSKKK